jgi:hypothetical protein
MRDNEERLSFYDEDFDTIAAVTKQKASWLVPRGTVD